MEDNTNHKSQQNANVGEEISRAKSIANRVQLLGDVDRLIYYKFYGLICIMNQKSPDVWPIDDDIDKRWDIKDYILDHLADSPEILFKGLTDFADNLEIINDKVYKSYFLHDGKLAMYVRSSK